MHEGLRGIPLPLFMLTCWLSLVHLLSESETMTDITGQLQNYVKDDKPGINSLSNINQIQPASYIKLWDTLGAGTWE